MPTNRVVYKYDLKKGNKIVHTGITKDLERREYEHQREFGNKVHIKQVGNRTTRKDALQWKVEQRQKGKPTGP